MSSPKAGRSPPQSSAKAQVASPAMGPKARLEFFAVLARACPHPTTELEYGSDFQLLAAVLLSAQSTDKQVNRCTRELFRVAPDAAAMVALGQSGIAEHIRSLGLWRAKAEHLWATAQRLNAEFAGRVPEDRRVLESLPGVGRKTANVILNTLFGLPVIAVDTHLFRLANRTGLAPGANVVQVERALMRRVPKAYLRDAHHWLILHGRYVCTARNPRCAECLVREWCRWPSKSGIEDAP